MSMCAAVLAPPPLLYMRHFLLHPLALLCAVADQISLGAATTATARPILIFSVLSGIGIVIGWLLGVGLVSRALWRWYWSVAALVASWRVGEAARHLEPHPHIRARPQRCCRLWHALLRQRRLLGAGLTVGSRAVEGCV